MGCVRPLRRLYWDCRKPCAHVLATGIFYGCLQGVTGDDDDAVTDRLCPCERFGTVKFSWQDLGALALSGSLVCTVWTFCAWGSFGGLKDAGECICLGCQRCMGGGWVCMWVIKLNACACARACGGAGGAGCGTGTGLLLHGLLEAASAARISYACGCGNVGESGFLSFAVSSCR